MTLRVSKHSNQPCSVIFVNFYNFLNNDVIMSSLVSTGNCKLGHDYRRMCSHRRRRRDKTVSSRRRRRCVLGITHNFYVALYLGHRQKHWNVWMWAVYYYYYYYYYYYRDCLTMGQLEVSLYWNVTLAVACHADPYPYTMYNVRTPSVWRLVWRRVPCSQAPDSMILIMMMIWWWRHVT